MVNRWLKQFPPDNVLATPQTGYPEEYDEMKRELEGSKVTKLTGKDAIGRHTVASEEGWTQEKTAKEKGMTVLPSLPEGKDKK